MKLGRYTLRSPIVKYVDMDIEAELYNAVRASIVEDIINQMKEETKHNIDIIKTFGPR